MALSERMQAHMANKPEQGTGEMAKWLTEQNLIRAQERPTGNQNFRPPTAFKYKDPMEGWSWFDRWRAGTAGGPKTEKQLRNEAKRRAEGEEAARRREANKGKRPPGGSGPGNWGRGPGFKGLDQGNLLRGIAGAMGDPGVGGSPGMPGIPGVAEGGSPEQMMNLAGELGAQSTLGMPMPGPMPPQTPPVIPGGFDPLEGPMPMDPMQGAVPEAMPEYGALAPLGMEDLPPPDAAMNAPGGTLVPDYPIPPGGITGTPSDYAPVATPGELGGMMPPHTPAGGTVDLRPVTPDFGITPHPDSPFVSSPYFPGGPQAPPYQTPPPNLQQLNQAAGTNRHQQEALNMFKPPAAPPQAPQAPQAPPVAPAAPTAAAGPAGPAGPAGMAGMASPGMPPMGAPSAMPPDMNADLMGVSTGGPPLNTLAVSSGAMPRPSAMPSMQTPKTSAFSGKNRLF